MAEVIRREFGVRYHPDHISRLLDRIRPKADANPGRAVREHAPVKWAS